MRFRKFFVLAWLTGLTAFGCGAAGTVGTPSEATSLVVSAKTAYYRGDYESAQTQFTRARQMFERFDDREGVAYTWNNLGSVALRAREYAQAERHFRKADTIFQAIGNTSGAAIATNNRGTALRYLGRREEARDAHEAARALAEMAADLVVQAAAYGGMGLVLLDNPEAGVAELDAAEQHFLAARALQRRAHDDMGEATTLGNLGALAALRDDVPTAITHYTAALELDRRLEYVGGIAQDLLALAELHLRAENYAAALTFADRALRVNEEIRDTVAAQRAAALIRDIEAQRGQGVAAHDPHEPAT